MRPQYIPREIYIGDNATTQFDFDFKLVNKAHLLVLLIDITDPTAPEEIFSVRGTDTTYFSTVLKTKTNGGYITFIDAPTEDQRILILLADDEPKQESKYTASTSYSMKQIEDSLDAMSGQIQRAKYLVDRAFRLPEKFTDDFDAEIQDFVPNGIPILDEDMETVTTKDITTILDEAGILDIIQGAVETADAALAQAQSTQADLDDLETDVSALTTRVTNAENTIASHTSQIDSLDTRTDALESDMNDAEADINDLQVIVEDHDTSIDNLITLTDDHETRITDNESELADHETRITNLESGGGGGGGSGGTFTFFSPTPGGAARETKFNRDVFVFDQDGFQIITGVLKRTLGSTSNQKSVTIGWFGDTVNDVVKWTIQSFLVKPGMLIDAGTFSYTEDVDVTVTTAKERIYTTLNFSDASGQIQAQDIDTNDEVIFLIRRDTAVGEIAGAKACIEQALTQLSFT